MVGAPPESSSSAHADSTAIASNEERFMRASVAHYDRVPVTSADGSLLSQRYSAPPSTPPAIGATQKSHSCAIAQPPTKSAGPVLRAGFTDVFVTGIPTRWMSVSPSPIAIGAKPAGALPCV